MIMLGIIIAALSGLAIGGCIALLGCMLYDALS